MPYVSAELFRSLKAHGELLREPSSVGMERKLEGVLSGRRQLGEIEITDLVGEYDRVGAEPVEPCCDGAVAGSGVEHQAVEVGGERAAGCRRPVAVADVLPAGNRPELDEVVQRRAPRMALVEVVEAVQVESVKGVGQCVVVIGEQQAVVGAVVVVQAQLVVDGASGRYC